VSIDGIHRISPASSTVGTSTVGRRRRIAAESPTQVLSVVSGVVMRSSTNVERTLGAWKSPTGYEGLLFYNISLMVARVSVTKLEQGVRLLLSGTEEAGGL